MRSSAWIWKSYHSYLFILNGYFEPLVKLLQFFLKINRFQNFGVLDVFIHHLCTELRDCVFQLFDDLLVLFWKIINVINEPSSFFNNSKIPVIQKESVPTNRKIHIWKEVISVSFTRYILHNVNIKVVQRKIVVPSKYFLIVVFFLFSVFHLQPNTIMVWRWDINLKKNHTNGKGKVCLLLYFYNYYFGCLLRWSLIFFCSLVWNQPSWRLHL